MDQCHYSSSPGAYHAFIVSCAVHIGKLCTSWDTRAATMLALLELPAGMSDLAENLPRSMLEGDPARRPTAAQLL